MMQLALVLLGLFAFLGGLLSWTYLSRIRVLENRVDELRRQLPSQLSERMTPDSEYSSPGADDSQRSSKASAPVAPAVVTPEPTSNKPPAEKTPSLLIALGIHLREFWMIWLGGLCVGLAGVFLVRYSIERGLLGPGARVLLGVAIGVSLHAVAEWLRRKRGGAPALAALAGGASITLYAAILAALRLYDLLSPGATFFLLAVVAVATMTLSLVHGPVLAVIGLLGAYAVPVLISDGSGAIVVTLIYASIITVAALLLGRYVYRVWFWLCVLAGALGWWSISLSYPSADSARPIYLAVLAYGLLAVPAGNWLLQHSERSITGEVPVLQLKLVAVSPLQLGYLLIAVAQAISVAHTGFSAAALLSWVPLVVVSVFAARVSPALFFVPWLSLAAQSFGWVLNSIQMSDGAFRLSLDEPGVHSFPEYAFASAFLYSSLSWWAGRGRGFDRARDTLMVLAPVCWTALAYLLSANEYLDPHWSIASALLGISYIFLSRSRLFDSESEMITWLITAAHFAYSLAAVILLEEATLTLALAVQVISLAWCVGRQELRGLDWLIKLVLAVILFRLTFNPWLLRYPVDIHWSLWTYGGATACVFIAALILPAGHGLKKWLAAASMQLLVLFLAAETRYLLYDGEIFRREYSLTEAAINSSLWGGMGLAYHLRASVAESLRVIYLNASALLLSLAFLNQVVVTLFLNPLWGIHAVGDTPILNVVFLAYGLPTVVAYLVYRYGLSVYKKAAGGMAALSLLVFVSLEIRHLWQGAVDRHLSTSDGELYSYSVAWLLMAIVAMVAGVRRSRRDIYLAGMSLLLIVVAKIFLVDTSGLEGLWRVASFMGLGLSLLGMAYTYQKFGGAGQAGE